MLTKPPVPFDLCVAVVAAFNQEKALVGAFSVIVQPVVEPMDQFATLSHLDIYKSLHHLQERAIKNFWSADPAYGDRIRHLIKTQYSKKPSSTKASL